MLALAVGVGSLQFAPAVGADRAFAPPAVCRFEPVLCYVELAVLGTPDRPQLGRFVLKTLQPELQALNTGTGCKELLAGIVPTPLQDVPPPGSQQQVV